MTQHSWSHFWLTPWSYQDNCQLWEWFYWLYRGDVEDWIRCFNVTCAATKVPETQLHSKLLKQNVGQPFGRIATDLAGPFPILQRSSWYTLVALDYFSKWCEAYPVLTLDAPEIAKVFVENWISHYGVPLELQTIQGRNSESNIFSGMCEHLKINKTRTITQKILESIPKNRSDIPKFFQAFTKFFWKFPPK